MRAPRATAWLLVWLSTSCADERQAPVGDPVGPGTAQDSDAPSDTAVETDDDPGADTDAPPPPCGTFVAATSLGSSGYDRGNHAIAAADGGTYAVLQFSAPLTLDPGGPAERTYTPAGDIATVIVKYDAAGAVAWSTPITSTGSARVGSLALTSDGFVVAGASEIDVTFAPGEPNAITLPGVGASDAFLARYDANGGLQWARVDGGTEYTLPGDLVVLSGDEVVVTGTYDGVATLGAGEVTETVLPDIGASQEGYLSRYGADGRLEWAQWLGGGAALHLTGARSDATGAIVAVGYVVGAGDTVFAPGLPSELHVDPGGEFGWLGRWHGDGALEWVVVEPGLAPWAVDLAADGSAVIAGRFYETATLGAGQPTETTLTSSATDLVVARYDATGVLAWATQSSSPEDTNLFPHAIAALPDGGAALVGQFGGAMRLGDGGPNEIVLATTASLVDVDAFAARFDGAGDLVCAWSFGHPSGWDGLYSLEPRPDGTFLSAGNYLGSIVLGAGQPTEAQFDAVGDNDGLVTIFAF